VVASTALGFGVAHAFCRHASSKASALKRFTPTSRLLPLRATTASASPALFANKHARSATQSDDPADVSYEKLGISSAKRLLRRGGLRALQYCVIGAAFCSLVQQGPQKTRGPLWTRASRCDSSITCS
jgi:hypothetical protein